ncbi:MAG: energy-coupling factor transporter transmembrane protein EcfT [Candidatus Heimdallarchaeum endolithica]|uniref:Energy-coupling factor transporter transmembrane protein EcfT n=1 Tax=Candidatus Heimdallarchaeum endolithica TaxID=2876572 RepID=A0A9Y1BRM7_9ARCH|nr:MAG: energy-coupling factor transporter transmembrane protein EcfT [Candidatus Heimdallarchaeum endolithica]
MSYLLNKIYSGLIFQSEGVIFNPIVSIIIVVIQFSFVFSSNIVIQVIMLSVIVLENIIFGNSIGAFNIVIAIFPLLVLLGGMTYIFSGFYSSLLTITRILNGGLSFVFFFSKTNPSELTRALENLHIPSKIALLPSLVLTLSPRIIKDAEETFETLRLRETRTTILKWLPKILAIFIASVLYRSEFLAQALYFKGFDISKRSHYKKVEFRKENWIRIITWFAISIGLSYIWITKLFFLN